MEILIRIDWISITDKRMKPFEVSAHPCLADEDWSECAGKNGYNVGGKHITGVREYRNYSRSDMGCHVVYSSKSLDRIKEMKNISGTDVLIHHIRAGHNVARIDLAIDFINYGATVEAFTFAFTHGYVKTKLRKASIIRSLVSEGSTLYIGSMKKRKNLVRVYDKGAEQGSDDNWVRVELQVMGKKATGVGIKICNSENIKETIIGIILGVVDFPTVDVWKNLTRDTDKIQMSSIPKEQGDTEKWLMKQVVPALSRTIVLNMNFWIQFKMALNREFHENTAIDDVPFDLV